MEKDKQLEELKDAVQKAIADETDRDPSPFFSYVDQDTGELKRENSE